MADLPAECSAPTSALVGVICRENIALMLINAYISSKKKKLPNLSVCYISNDYGIVISKGHTTVFSMP
jgi:hypothetical protein